MFYQKDIFFPTDFSPFAQYAMTYAVALAKTYKAKLHVAHVLDSALFGYSGEHGIWLTKSGADDLLLSMTEHANARLEYLIEKAEHEGVEAESHITKGRPFAEAIRLADELGCGLVVIPTHGHSGLDRIVHGSVCERVVRQSPVPVLCIKHPEHEFVRESDMSISLKRILFPTDFSDFAMKGMPYAVSLCKMFHASLILAHVVEIPAMIPELLPETGEMVYTGQDVAAEERLNTIDEKLTDEGVNVEIQILNGQPYREISLFVEDSNIDLVVMPTHGRTGISHLLFGSVAEKVIRLAKCPVLTIRPEKFNLNE